MTELKRIALCDIAHWFRPAFEASKGEAERGGYEATLNAVYEVEDSRIYDAVVCCADKGPYLRTLAYPEYKANREEPDEVMGPLLERTIKKLKENFPVFSAKGYEADDIIATLCEHANKLGIIVDIFTNDKDLFQLVNERVTCVSTRSGKHMTPHDVAEKMVHPKQMVDYQALVGDKSDNIPGCPGIGHVAAVKLLNSYDTVADVLVAAERGRLITQGITTKQAQNLKIYADQINQSLALVTLFKDAPVVWGDIIQEKTEVTEVDNNKPETAGIRMRDIADVEPPEENEARGNSLVGGALARLDGPGIADAVDREERTILPPAPVNDELTSGIELRPGCLLTPGKYQLMTRLAQDFHSSGLYKQHKSPQGIFAVLLQGMEMGLSPATSLSLFHIIEGKPSPTASFLLGRARQDPDCVYLEMKEETEAHVTYVCKKRSYPEEQSFTYRLQDAIDDGLRWATGRDKKNRRAMLRARASSQASRLFFGGACMGLYSVEEMTDAA